MHVLVAFPETRVQVTQNRSRHRLGVQFSRILLEAIMITHVAD